MRPYDVSELEAYVDGELDAVRRAELAAWLSRNPDAQAVAETLRYQNAGLHAVFEKLLHRPVPPRLLSSLDQASSGRRARLGHLPLIWVVAGGLLLVAAALIGWLANDYSFGQRSQDDQLAAHLEEMQEAAAFCDFSGPWPGRGLEPGPAPGADSASLQVLLAEEGSSALPGIESKLRLVEARVLPGESGLSAVLFFTNDAGSQVSLFIQRRGSEEELSPRLVEREGVSYFIWSDGPLSCTLVAPDTV